MNDERSKRLRMIAGPNGSGKSSVIRDLAKERSSNGLFWLNYYLNADDVERGLVSAGVDLAAFDVSVTFADLCSSLQKGGRIAADHPFYREGRLVGSVLFSPQTDGYLAAAIVDLLREILMSRGDSFSFETVMSHDAKVEDFRRARDAGYKTYLYYVATNSAELNVARVRSRVSSGGHPVAEDKIRERYVRSLKLAPAAIRHAYRAYFFDNSGTEPIWLAEFGPTGDCVLKTSAQDLPKWFVESILNRR